LLGLSLCLAVATGLERGSSVEAAAADGCPTRFDFEVLASAADSGNLLGVSAYRFRRDARYSAIPITGLQRVAFQSAPTGCQMRRQTALQRG